MRFSIVAQGDLPQVTGVEAPFAELIPDLEPLVGEKDGPALIPAVLVPEYRKDKNVTHMTAAVFDVDFTTVKQFEVLRQVWKEFDLSFLAFETFSHGKKGPRYRVLFPAASELPLSDPDQWVAYWPELVDYFQLTGKVDPTCCNPSRLYYLPRHPEGETRQAWSHQGTHFDWSDVGPLPSARPPATPVAPRQVTTAAADIEEIRALLKRSKNAALQNALLGKAPAESPRNRRPGESSRYETWRKLAADASMLVESDVPTEALLDIFEPAWHAEVEQDPDDHTPLETVELLFDTALNSAPQRKADIAERARVAKEKFYAASRRLLPQSENLAEIPQSEPLAEEENEHAQGRSIYTDLRNAERVRTLYGHQISYLPALQRWYMFEGKRWTENADGVTRFAAASVRAMYVEAAQVEDLTTRDALFKWAFKSESSDRIRAAERLVKAHTSLHAQLEDFDSAPYLLNLDAGTVDLRTGSIRQHSYRDMLTKVLEVPWEPEATCPTWEGFLLRVQPDGEIRHFLQKAIGYSLTASVQEQLLFFLSGGGSNGKSTFLNTLQALLGEYATQGAPDLLLASSNERHLAEVAALHNKRVIVCSEVEKGRYFAEVRVKQLTGADSIDANFMYGNHFQFRPTFKIWLSANDKPPTKGTDHALWRRMVLVPFLKTISESEIDRQLDIKLRRELPGILQWAVRGCLLWQKEGLALPPSIKAAVKEYRADQDVLAHFLEDSCAGTPNGEMVYADLVRLYTSWWAATNQHGKPLSSRTLGNALRAKGLKVEYAGHKFTMTVFGLPKKTGPATSSSAAKDFQLPEGKA